MPRGTKVDLVPAFGDEIETESAVAVLPTFAELNAALSDSFDKTYQRQIPGGMSLTYITGEQAMGRLTETVGPNWSWAVKSTARDDGDVMVTGTLKVTYVCQEYPEGIAVTREGIGGAKVKKSRQSGDTMDLGNDFKAAETGALKRAAAKFGVGLYLYEKTEGGEAESPSRGEPMSYGQQGSYAPAANRAPVQFGQPSGSGTSVTGPIEAVSMPRVGDDGKQKLGGLKVNGAWYNVSNRNPIQLGQYQRGQVITVAHPAGANFIDAISLGGAPAAAETEEIEAF